MNFTIEQLKFAREIGATHRAGGKFCVETKDGFLVYFATYGKPGGWKPSAFPVALRPDFAKIDFSPLDDYYADKSVDIAATSVPDGYYHDDEEDKLKPLKPESVPLQYDPSEVAFKSDKNERGAGMKYDSGKPRMSLVPPHALTEMAKVMTFGASKYKAHSWKQVENAQERYLDALLRHAIAYVAGERIDPESGLPTMAHIMCDAAFLIEMDMFNNSARSTEVNK